MNRKVIKAVFTDTVLRFTLKMLQVFFLYIKRVLGTKLSLPTEKISGLTTMLVLYSDLNSPQKLKSHEEIIVDSIIL